MLLLSRPLSARAALVIGGDGHLDDLRLDAELLEGLGRWRYWRFLEVRFLERVDVDDDDAAGLEEFDILLESSRGIHGYQHVALVAGGVDACADAHLKARDTAERALRGADFGRIVGEGRHLGCQCRQTRL